MQNADPISKHGWQRMPLAIGNRAPPGEQPPSTLLEKGKILHQGLGFLLGGQHHNGVGLAPPVQTVQKKRNKTGLRTFNMNLELFLRKTSFQTLKRCVSGEIVGELLK